MHTADLAHKLGKVKEALHNFKVHLVTQLRNHLNNYLCDDQPAKVNASDSENESHTSREQENVNKTTAELEIDMLKNILMDEIHPFELELFISLVHNWDLSFKEFIAAYKKFHECSCK